MKNTILKTIGTAWLAILMLATFAQVQVSAQDIFNGQPIEILLPPDSNNTNTQTLEGSWSAMVTFTNCQTGVPLRPPFPAMNTFMRGGTMQEFGIGSGLLRTPGHGVWSHQSGRTYTNAFQFFLFNADGTFANTVRARGQIELSRSGFSYTSTGTSQFFAPNGNLVMSGCVNVTATRFTE